MYKPSNQQLLHGTGGGVIGGCDPIQHPTTGGQETGGGTGSALCPPGLPAGHSGAGHGRGSAPRTRPHTSAEAQPGGNGPTGVAEC